MDRAGHATASRADLIDHDQEVAELRAANERLTAYASTVSHDLLQPIAALDGFLGLLVRFADVLNPEHREWLAGAVRCRVRLTDAIDALHRGAAAEQVESEPVSVASVLAEVVADCSADTVPIEVFAGDLPVVEADRGLLVQVLGNLLQNSVRYCGQGPVRIAAEARAEGDTWTIVLIDNGQGIDDDELEAVFERGRRGRAARATHGTGTGLATVRTLMRRMAGDAWAERSPHGAKIALRLPAVTV